MPVILQVKSAGTLVVSDEVPIMMISVLSIFSFIKLSGGGGGGGVIH